MMLKLTSQFAINFAGAGVKLMNVLSDDVLILNTSKSKYSLVLILNNASIVLLMKTD